MGPIGMRFKRIEKTEDHKDRPCNDDIIAFTGISEKVSY